jgi:hypothetical protein
MQGANANMHFIDLVYSGLSMPLAEEGQQNQRL